MGRIASGPAALETLRPERSLFTPAVEILMSYMSCLLCLCARLFIYTLWSPTGKGLASWL